jgi:hypothetical protein
MAVAETLATSYVVTTAGMGLARGFVWSRGALESYFGPGPSKRALARLVNAGLWADGTAATCSAGVAYVGRANQRHLPPSTDHTRVPRRYVHPRLNLTPKRLYK